MASANARIIKADKPSPSLPGHSLQAVALLPVRAAFSCAIFAVTYPILLSLSLARAIYLRVAVGTPSQILKKGAYNAAHWKDMHYPSHVIFNSPLDEKNLTDVLLQLCEEGGINRDEVEVKFHEEKPRDWPEGKVGESGSFDIDYFIESQPETHYINYWTNLEPLKKFNVRIHVWNGAEGKPTIMYYAGSGQAWDGSSNFNFVKELMSRYYGSRPNDVFKRPDVSESAAALMDKGSFVWFLMKMPLNVARNLGLLIWNLVRAAKWAGGNGIGFKIAAMNFNKEESLKLYAGSKKLGAKPFSAFSYAAFKACKTVLKQTPSVITQQASLQSRHYPIQGQTTRDLVGDWLFGPVQYTNPNYSLSDAQAGYVDLRKELDEIGPSMRRAIWAKAYGLFNSGAAGFELLPTYNDDMHVFDRCIFMNNYGVRTTEIPLTWNWNAPLYFGVNTINVNGCTTTLVGSLMWGQDVVNAMRDDIEQTLREMMDKAENVPSEVPTFKKGKD